MEAPKGTGRKTLLCEERRPWPAAQAPARPLRPGRLPARLSLPALLSLAALLVAAGCGGDREHGQKPSGPLPVAVYTARAEDVPLHGEWVGTVDGYVNAQIQPQVSGYLIAQTYKEGSVVQKGQVLFEIDPRPFQAVLDQAIAQLGQARGQLAQAQAALGLSEINVKRDTPLAAQKAIAQSQLDNDIQQRAQNEAQVEAARAQIAAAGAAIETARLNLGFTHVRSLIAGVAGQAAMQVGNLVGPQSVLTAVSQLNPIKVYFAVSDNEYLSLLEEAKQQGGDLLKASSRLPLTLTLSNGREFPQQGRIVFVDRQMNQQTGAIRIAAAFANPGNVLRPGQFGRISAATQIRHNTVLVPQAAVQELQGIQQVFTVGQGNKAHLVNLKLGPQVGNSWMVISGLSAGTEVITDNLQKLQEGTEVAPHPGPAAAPTALVGGAAAGK